MSVVGTGWHIASTCHLDPTTGVKHTHGLVVLKQREPMYISTLDTRPTVDSDVLSIGESKRRDFIMALRGHVGQ